MSHRKTNKQNIYHRKVLVEAEDVESKMLYRWDPSVQIFRRGKELHNI
jgi:hypothetical protein